MPLDADVVRLAKGPNLATVVTLMPDGQPQALLTWIDTDGENLLVNTEPSRQALEEHRPRSAGDGADPLRRQPVRLGRGSRHRDRQHRRRPGPRHIDELSRRYVGTDYAAPIGPDGRIVFVISPSKVNTPKLLASR
jgi:hypothetical protein